MLENQPNSLFGSRATASGVIQVDSRKLDTAIELRNRHMREGYLETQKYP